MKNVLLIAGGGALGNYTAKELLALGNRVDVICLEDRVSDDERLTYIKQSATVDFLEELFSQKHYDGIVNFLHYENAEGYAPFHKLLSANTEHLIFLSSYRVYADLQHPITETAPRLGDVIKDDIEFLETEDYAMGKYRCEEYIKSLDEPAKWTIVRPVISFAGSRFDLIMHSGHILLEALKNGTVLPLPELSRKKTAGLDWAGNSGKLIANLLFKKEALGEAYTVSSGQNLCWEEVADIYAELLGLKFEWIDTEKYKENELSDYEPDKYRLIYDRLYDRKINPSKIFGVTGLKKEDFTDIKSALKFELKKANII